MLAFRRILWMKSDSKRFKEFFNQPGCGLEIEFGISYRECDSRYIKTGLEKLHAAVSGYGKFVPDITVQRDFNIEIVLNPLPKDILARVYWDIKRIIDCYDNFIVDENCGIHANFLADWSLKERFYSSLLHGGYDSSRFSHNKYKVDFWQIASSKPDGALMTFEEFVDYQRRICGKYTAVNFLKGSLIEFRALDYSWENIAYVIDLYEAAAEDIKQTAATELLENPAFV
jgi:hypothetical protein